MPQQGTTTGTPLQISDINNPEPNNLSAGLSPSGPGQQIVPTPPVVPSPTAAAPQVAPPQTPPGPPHAFGTAVGRVLRGLSGGHQEYTIDPNTGQTQATYVKEPPGQTFRSILAMGLLGGQGIGPEHGQHTFTQGLLAGLGGGVKESMERSDMLDKQRRAEAQEQYQNQLKAAQEKRENQKLTMEEQLNKVAIANHNQEMAIREKTFNEHLADREAAGYLQAAQTSMAADAPKLEGFKSLNIDPIQDETGKALQGLTADQLHDYLSKHPGAATKYVSLASGVQQKFDPNTGKTDVQTTYSIYPGMTKVPPALIDDIKAVGGDKPGSELYTMYKDLTPKTGQQVSAETLFAAYRRLNNWENIQDKVLGIQEKQTRMSEEKANTSRAYIEANAAQFNLKNQQQAQLAGDLFTDHFSNATGSLTNMEQLAPVTPEEAAKNKWTPTQAKKEDDKRAEERTLLGRMVNAQYQVGLKDYTDHAKVYKDEFGKPITDNPELVVEGNRLSGLAKAQSQLQGGSKPGQDTNTDPYVDTVVNGLQNYKNPQGASLNAQEILDQVNSSGKLSPDQKQQALKKLGLDKGVTQVRIPGGVVWPVATANLDAFLAQNPGASLATATPSNNFNFSNK